MSDGRTGGPRRPPRPGASSGPPAAAPRPTKAKTPAKAKAKTPAKAKAPVKAATAMPKAPAKATSKPTTPAKARSADARRAPTPAAPGPRPERTARQRSAPAKASTSSIRFRDLPTGEVQTAASSPRSSAAPTAAERAADAAPKMRRDWTGRVRAVRPDPATILPPPTPATAFRQRYGVVYDTHGPRMRIGVLWCVVVILSLAYEPTRPYGLAMVFGIAAGIAAVQVVDAWHPDRNGPDRWVAALGGATLPVLATEGTRLLGAGFIVLVLAAAITAFLVPRSDGDPPVFATAGLTVLGAGVCGGAAAALVLLANYEIGAVIILLIFLMVYDASDFIVGSGASNGVEGPFAGALFIFATSMLLAFTEVPPFRGVDVWNFAVLAAVACPAGQLIASAMLPRANAKAPALRRIDSMLVAAPAWAGLIGLYLQSSGH